MVCVPCLPGNLCLGCTCSYIVMYSQELHLALLCNSTVHSLRTMIEFLSIPSSAPVTEPERKEMSFDLCPSSPHVSREHANIGADCGSLLPL